jgi:RNA polymerase-binding transcription factor DksA
MTDPALAVGTCEETDITISFTRLRARRYLGAVLRKEPTNNKHHSSWVGKHMYQWLGK